MRDDLWGNAIFLKEANAISVELQKKVGFQFVLLSDTLYSPLPAELSASASSSAKPGASRHQQQQQQRRSVDSPFPRSVVAVQVTDQKNGATHLWSLEKLRQRLELMRDMYHNEAEMLPPPPPPQQQQPQPPRGDSASSAAKQQQQHQQNGGDPFYDRFPWFRVVGRGFVYISNLVYPLPLVHRVSVVNERGAVQGFLKIAVTPVFEDDDESSGGGGGVAATESGGGGSHHLAVPDGGSGVRHSGNARISFDDNEYFKKKRVNPVVQHQNNAGYGYGAHGLNRSYSEDNLRIVEGQGLVHDSLLAEAEQRWPSGGGGGENGGGRGPLLPRSANSCDESEFDIDALPDHLQLGHSFMFRVTVLEAEGIPPEYADIFCQFNFLHR